MKGGNRCSEDGCISARMKGRQSDEGMVSCGTEDGDARRDGRKEDTRGWCGAKK
jgi:hypothetical protein